jgi:hypothetical protein
MYVNRRKHAFWGALLAAVAGVAIPDATAVRLSSPGNRDVVGYEVGVALYFL